MKFNWFDPDYFDPDYFDTADEDPGLTISGSAAAQANATGSLTSGFIGLSEGLSGTNSVLRPEYNLNGLSTPISQGTAILSTLYKISGASHGVLSTNAVIRALALEVEIFNNDPDVKINDHVILFKGK